VEPFLVASSLNCVVAQRLARKICSDCSDEEESSPQTLIDVGVPPEEAAKIKVFRGAGCPLCSNTGYRGRIAIYEVMLVGEEIKEFVLNGASAAEIKREAIRLGMKTLRQSALTKLSEGVTTIEEVLRVSASD
jgi:type IV pilus assembly protein PilB